MLPRWPRSRHGAASGNRQLLVAAAVVGLLVLLAVAWLLVRDEVAEGAAGSPPPATDAAAEPVTTAATPTLSSSSPTSSPSGAAKASSGGKSRTSRPKSSAARIPVIAPDARFTNSCSYVAGDPGTDGGPRFVAESKIVNTGNIDIEVDVVARWSQADEENVTESTRVRVNRGDRVTARISVPVSEREIDLIRQHKGPGDNCTVESAIVATLGDPQ